jgi:hypothetical protein
LIEDLQEAFYDFYGTMVPGILSLYCIFNWLNLYVENYDSIVFIVVALISSYILGILLNFIARIVFGYKITKDIIDNLSLKRIIYSLRKEDDTKELQKTDYKKELEENEKLIRDYFLQTDDLIECNILKTKLKKADINSFSNFLLRRYDNSSLLQKYIAKTNLFINLSILFLIIFVRGLINNILINNMTCIIKVLLILIFIILITKVDKKDQTKNVEEIKAISNNKLKSKTVFKKPFYIILIFICFIALDYGYMIFESVNGLRPTVYKRIGFNYYDYIWNLILTWKLNPLLLNGYIISYILFLASEFEYDRHCKLKDEERFFGILNLIKKSKLKENNL